MKSIIHTIYYFPRTKVENKAFPVIDDWLYEPSSVDAFIIERQIHENLIDQSIKNELKRRNKK
jgi:hypothetical protein